MGALRGPILTALTLFWSCCWLPGAGVAQAQETQGAEVLLRLAPDPDHPPAPAPLAESPDRMARIEAHLRDLEERNRRLQEQYDSLARQYDRYLDQAAGRGRSETSDEGAEGEGNKNGTGAKLGAANANPFDILERPFPEVEEEEGAGLAGGRVGADILTRGRGRGLTGGLGRPLAVPAGGEERPPAPAMMEDYLEKRGPYQPNNPPVSYGGKVRFREGLELESDDGWFLVTFHNLSQLDLRLFDPTGDPLHDNFIIPRQRWYFQGNISPYATFYTVINRGYGSLDVLDSWVDYNFAPKYKDQLQFRIGRMKTPYTYEYIKISESDLIAPERSLFVGNFAPNREMGAMAHGQLFERTFEYALGVFNGPRRSFQDFNDSKDLFAFINTKPFLHSQCCWLQQLNIGGSVNGGSQHNPLQPSDLSTANDQSTSASVSNVSPIFLTFKNNVFESGPRMQWSGDLAYYYKSFTMLAGYQGGFQSYALSNASLSGNSTFAGVVGHGQKDVPLTGWSVAATYFLTGEEITRRVYLVEPVRPFGFYNGRLNPGAIELYSRIANLQLGDQVFTGGFADPKLWANRATAIDTGVNWYLNHYVRFYVDWQYSMFNNPVQIAPDKFTRHENLFWLRTQVFF